MIDSWKALDDAATEHAPWFVPRAWIDRALEQTAAAFGVPSPAKDVWVDLSGAKIESPATPRRGIDADGKEAWACPYCPFRAGRHGAVVRHLKKTEHVSGDRQ